MHGKNRSMDRGKSSTSSTSGVKEKGSSSSSVLDLLEKNGGEIDIQQLLKDIEFLGSSHMSWKERKDLENRKVVSLGGKAPKKNRIPLSVARVTMKKQKDREQKSSQEGLILGHFGGRSANSNTSRGSERRKAEDRVLRTTEGHFSKGVLDVKDLLRRDKYGSNDRGSGSKFSRPVNLGGGGGPKKGGGKNKGKKKGGKKGGIKRHADSSQGLRDENNTLERASELMDEMVTTMQEFRGFQNLFDSIEAAIQGTGSRPMRQPPASKEVIEKLPVVSISKEMIESLGIDMECAVCRENVYVNEKMHELPCKHLFHPHCLIPWMDIHNSCPICRHELPTDDDAYESWKEREKEARKNEMALRIH